MAERHAVRTVRGVAALGSLALRRAVSPWTLAATAAWLLLLATRDWVPEGVRLAGEFDASGSAVAAAQARTGVLGAALAFVAPLLLWRVVGIHARTQGPERSGLAAAPVGELARQVGLWTGASVGAALLCLACALAAELATPNAETSPRPVVGRLDNPALTLLARGDVERFELPSLPRGSERIQVELVVLPAAETTSTVELRVMRLSEPAARASARASVAGRRALAVDLPEGTGPMVLELERQGPGAGVGLPRHSLLVLGPARSPYLASGALVGRAWLGLVLAAALVPLLGRALSPGLGGLLLASVWIAAWRGAPLLGGLPGSSFFDDLAATSLGLSAAVPSLSNVALTSALALGALVATATIERRSGGAPT